MKIRPPIPDKSPLVTAMAAAVMTLSACGKPASGPETDTLRINLATEPPSLDWHVSTDFTSFDVVSNLMVGLTQYRNDLSCAPACAKSWQMSPDGKRYLFTLRDDIKWSDGKKLSAYDFEYAWLRMLNPSTGAQYAYFLYDIEGAFEFNTGKCKDPSSVKIKALDDQHFEVILKKPASYFINLTAICPSYPQRKDVVEKWGNRWTEPAHMVSNGPFLLESWQHEYKISLKANPNFFEGAPKLKRIKMFMIPEQATAFALYANDQLDYIDNRSFPTPEVAQCKGLADYRNFPLLRNNYIGFNVKKAPFDNELVRQAFSLAIDRTIFPRILRRNEMPSYTWTPPKLQGEERYEGQEFNPQKAKQLLAEAGYPDGKGFPSVTVYYPTREDVKLVMEAIQDQLKRNLNLKINLENQEWKVFLETLRRDPPPMFRSSWGADYPDPETFMNLFTSHSGTNDTCWKNADYDKLISAASGEADKKKRFGMYRRADQFLCRKAVPIVCTFLSTQNMMIKPWVKGIGYNPLDLQFFKSVEIDESKLKY